MLYQYDEDCAGDGVIVVRIYTSERLRGVPRSFFWVMRSKGAEVVDRMSRWDKQEILPGYGHKIF